MIDIDLKKINLDDVGFLRFRRIKDKYLLTNDSGQSLFLGGRDFMDFIEGRLDKNSLAYDCLDRKNFLQKTIDVRELSEQYRNKYSYLRRGTSLHIVIPTLRCNHRCTYCQASAHSDKAGGLDMNKKTAKKVVDAIFTSPSNYITIEFQGGEPVLNWEVVSYIIDISIAKNKRSKKNLSFVLVSNLTLFTNKILKSLLDRKVNICTSLDGPKFIHDQNRPMINGESGYDLTTKWIKEISLKKPGFSDALVTLTKLSLNHPQEIINEYLRWGMCNIPLRPVSTLGYAGQRRDSLGISAHDFILFYRKALDYMIELNYTTERLVTERMAKVCLQKIFNQKDPGYLDMRSPCGAGCGQLAYYYDGRVYTCDEARMLGDDSFMLGNVNNDSYQDLMQSKKMKAAVLSSCLDGLYCEYCAYKPYCGVCPVLNWKEFGTIYAQNSGSFMCKVYKGMFDYIFESLQDKRKERILKSWIGR
ncbi:MAG: His-Xaa-Ser system radical SAM maturase HxsB [Candidatus Omnitrophica bacterium]|nr:His-Xaa-Ser system radical SAM maturase HxsB [Candidatus Omnitrophota bacterium]